MCLLSLVHPRIWHWRKKGSEKCMNLKPGVLVRMRKLRVRIELIKTWSEAETAEGGGVSICCLSKLFSDAFHMWRTQQEIVQVRCFHNNRIMSRRLPWRGRCKGTSSRKTTCINFGPDASLLVISTWYDLYPEILCREYSIHRIQYWPVFMFEHLLQRIIFTARTLNIALGVTDVILKTTQINTLL